MTHMKKQIFFNLILVVFFSMLALSGETVEKRTFKEINVESDEKQEMAVAGDPHEMIQGMPDDDIHKAVRSGGAMGSNLDAMPNDDIHAKFRNGMMANSDALMNSVAPTSLSWIAPEGWSEEKGNGMRIATFKAGEGNAAVETSIISLAGQAGGISANVGRWMGQLGMEIPSEDKMNEFVNRQQKLKTSDGLDVTMIDLTQLQEDADGQTPSMIAAVIESQSNQIFVKMTGPKEAVLKNVASLKSLVQSMKNNI